MKFNVFVAIAVEADNKDDARIKVDRVIRKASSYLQGDLIDSSIEDVVAFDEGD